jgi:hypothetical protein
MVPIVPTVEQFKLLFEEVRKRVTHEPAVELADIARLANHGIPYYAYGDNQAGCEMAHRLESILKLCSPTTKRAEHE